MSTAGPLIVVGDALLDCDVDGQVSRLCPDAPAPVLEDAVPTWRPGGAALAALLAATEEIPVILVAPLGDDEASATVRALLEPHVTVVSLPLTGALAEKTRFRAGGRTLLRADQGSGAAGPAGAEATEAITAAGAILVSDYGRGVTADKRVRAALSQQAQQVPLVWDPHPRGARSGTAHQAGHAELRRGGRRCRPASRAGTPSAPLSRYGGRAAEPVLAGERGGGHAR